MPTQENRAADVARYRQNYLVEMDGIELYRALAAAEKDERRAVIFRKMAQTEERHARRWVRLIETAGFTVPDYRPTVRVRVLAWMAKHFGTHRVIPIISSLEASDEPGYLNQPEAVGLPATCASAGAPDSAAVTRRPANRARRRIVMCNLSSPLAL